MGSYVKKKIEFLVVDTSAFINKAEIQELGESIYTVPLVVEEIKSKRQLRRLVVLPYDLCVKEAFPENVKFVSEFSKKTGDYATLSLADINVIALTYQLEKEKNGDSHLNSVPVAKPTIQSVGTIPEDLKKIAGFYLPNKAPRPLADSTNSDDHSVYDLVREESRESAENEEEFGKGTKENDTNEGETAAEAVCDLVREESRESAENEEEFGNGTKENDTNEGETAAEAVRDLVREESRESAENEEEFGKGTKENDTNEGETAAEAVRDLVREESRESAENEEEFGKGTKENDTNEGETAAEARGPEHLLESLSVSEDDGGERENENVEEVLKKIEEEEEEEQEEEEEDEDEDDSQWITPSNIEKVKIQIASELEEIKNVSVACLTTDFAMQNVLKQIGLSVVSLDGKLIKQLRTFILRCYGCFKTTSIMTKVFCPNCGNKTLKRVAVSLDENGVQHLHINFRKPLTARGKKYSLPRFKGGKHSNNPVLFEDQPMPEQRPSRMTRIKNDPLNDDYLAGYSPFITRDVTSRSALLGIKPHVEMKHWMRKNPNESKKKKK